MPFLVRLLDGDEPVRAVGAGQADIPNAAKQCCCASEEVIRLILRSQARAQMAAHV
jgi:hypothetical protein